MASAIRDRNSPPVGNSPRPGSAHVRLPDGARVNIRSLVPADLRRGPEFFNRLSARSRYLRFMMPVPTLTPNVLAMIARQARNPRCAVLLAYVRHASGTEIVGGGRVVATRRRGNCEFALTIVDAWQRRGVGIALLRALVTRARALRYRHIDGEILAANTAMLAVARRVGFRARIAAGGGGVVTVSRPLWPSATARPSSGSGAVA